MSRNERFIMTNATMITTEQMELGFNPIQFNVLPVRRAGRIARASWWFDRMRAVVEQAIDWTAPETPRPEQIWMPGVSREVRA